MTGTTDELTPERLATHKRAAESILHHVRWHSPEIALELAQALLDVASRHGYATIELAKGAQELRRELEEAAT